MTLNRRLDDSLQPVPPTSLVEHCVWERAALQRWLDKLSEQSYWAMPSWSKAWYPEQVQTLVPSEEWKRAGRRT